jgi:hypothetical protein
VREAIGEVPVSFCGFVRNGMAFVVKLFENKVFVRTRCLSHSHLSFSSVIPYKFCSCTVVLPF